MRSWVRPTDQGQINSQVGDTHFVSSHIWTRLEAVANSESDRWWSIELWEIR